MLWQVVNPTTIIQQLVYVLIYFQNLFISVLLKYNLDGYKMDILHLCFVISLCIITTTTQDWPSVLEHTPTAERPTLPASRHKEPIIIK